MRPDVAQAYDRLARAASRAGVPLTVVSGFRSNAEQARLFAANPNPRMVAPPGRSNHRLGFALDLGPAASYGWLAANAPRFGFAKPMSWEPWHQWRALGITGRGATWVSSGLWWSWCWCFWCCTWRDASCEL